VQFPANSNVFDLYKVAAASYEICRLQYRRPRVKEPRTAGTVFAVLQDLSDTFPGGSDSSSFDVREQIVIGSDATRR